MAEQETDILLRARFDDSEAIANIANAKKAVADLRAEQKKLDTTTEDGRKSYESYNAQIRALNQTIRLNQRAVDTSIQQDAAATGSKAALRAETALLTAQIDRMSKAERESTTGQEVIARNAAVVAQLKEIEEGYGDNRRSVGNYERATISLRTQMAQLTEQMVAMRVEGQADSVAYRAVAEQAAVLRDAIGDTTAEINNMASDTYVLDGVNQAFQGLVGVVGLYSAALGLSAESSKEVQEVIKRMQIVMGALNSLQAIQNSLQDQSSLMKLKQIVIDKIITVQTLALARAKEAEARGTALAAVQQRIYNAIALANPYVLILTGVLALGAAYIALTAALGKVSLAEKSIQDVRKTVNASLVEETARLELYSIRIKEAQAGRGDFTQSLKEYNSAFKESGELTKEIIGNEQLYNEFLDKRIANFKALETQKETMKEITKLSREGSDMQLGFFQKLASVSKVFASTSIFLLDSQKFQADQQEKLTQLTKENADAVAALKREYNDATAVVEQFNKEQLIAAQQKEIYKLRLENMSEGLAREKALLDLSYVDQRRSAEDNSELLFEIEAKFQKEMMALVKKYTKEQADKRFEIESKRLEQSKALMEAELKLQRVLETKRLDEIQANGGVRLASQQQLDREQYDQQKKYSEAKLKLQRQTNKITEREYSDSMKIIQIQTNIFNETQLAELKKFQQVQLAAMSQLVGENATAEIAELRRVYASAYEELAAMQELSAGDREMRRIAMAKEEERLISDLLVNAEKERHTDELAGLADYARERIAAEIAIQEKVIEIKKATGQPTDEAEARLRALRRSGILADQQFELGINRDGAKKEYEIKKASLLAQLELAQGNADETAKLRKQLADLEDAYFKSSMEKNIARAEQLHEVFSMISESMSNASESRLQKIEADSNREKDILKKQLDSGYLSQREYAKKVEKLDKEVAARKASEARSEATRNKALAMFDVSIKTAQAIINASLTQPFLPMGLIMAATAGAMGAAQLAAIASAPLPKAAMGRLVKGKSHANGGEIIEAEAGEIIMNKNSSAAFKPLLSAMNVAGGGVPFTAPLSDGGFSMREYQRRGSSNINVDELSTAIADSLASVKIYTAIEDINRAERLFTQNTDTSKI